MTKENWKILADILDLAYMEFSNYPNVDYELDNTPENRKIIEGVGAWFYGKENFSGIHFNNDETKILADFSMLLKFYSKVASGMTKLVEVEMDSE